MKPSKKVKNFTSTIMWENYYIVESEDYFNRNEHEEIQEFRFELLGFLNNLETKWFNRSDWKAHWNERREKIELLYEQLLEISDLLEKEENELQRRDRVLAKMEKAALPEINSEVSERRASEWAFWPIRFSDRHKERMKRTQLPVGRRVVND